MWTFPDERKVGPLFKVIDLKKQIQVTNPDYDFNCL